MTTALKDTLMVRKSITALASIVPFATQPTVIGFHGYYARYKAKRPKSILLASARVRAKKNELPFDLTADDFEIPSHCPVLGIPIFVQPVRTKNDIKRNLPNSPSLDRIRPELGYVRGNVQVISWRANDIKSDATAEELRLVADFVATQKAD